MTTSTNDIKTSTDDIIRMMREIELGAHEVLARNDGVYIRPEQSIVCHFDVSPTLRYVRYVTAFNSLLNKYTEFEFYVGLIRNGCIDVTYCAKEFCLTEKNSVRKSVARMLRHYDVISNFHITHVIVFGSHIFPKCSWGVVDDRTQA